MTSNGRSMIVEVTRNKAKIELALARVASEEVSQRHVLSRVIISDRQTDLLCVFGLPHIASHRRAIVHQMHSLA